MTPPVRLASPGTLLDIADVAEQRNTSLRHICRLVAEHRIPVVRFGVSSDPTDIAPLHR